MQPNSDWAAQQREQGMRAAAYAAKQQEEAEKRAVEAIRIAHAQGREPTPEEIAAAMRGAMPGRTRSATRTGARWLLSIVILPVLLAGLALVGLSVWAIVDPGGETAVAAAILAGSLLIVVVASVLLRRIRRIGR
ncbi:MAG: hypothetical protein L0206_17245 [Actinobacteria bacterium]|nr:hypothetical protein [Actinomycetota bacterium]